MSTSITPFTIFSLFSQWVDRVFCWYLPSVPFIPSHSSNATDTAPSHSSVSTPNVNDVDENRSVELKMNPVHSPLIMRDLTTSITDDDSHSTDSSAVDSSTTNSTWLYHIQHNRRLYDFCVWTAIVYPLPYTASNPATPSLYTESQILWKQRWVIFCHFCCLIQICTTCSSATELYIGNEKKDESVKVDAVMFLSSIGTVLPVVTILPLILILKYSITQSLLIRDKTNIQYNDVKLQSSTSTLTLRESTKQETKQIPYLSENTFMRLNPIVIGSIINHAISLGKGIFVSLSIIPFLFGFIELVSIGLVAPSNAALASYYAFTVLEVWTLIPPTGMLVAILSFLVMDQRYSYYMLLEMRQKALSNEVVDHVYLMIGKRLEIRDSKSPLNLLVGIAIVMILICATNLTFYNSHTSMSIASHIFSSLVLIFLVGKEIIVLLVVIYFMLEVNDMADQLLHQVNRRMSIEIKDERLRLRRVELLLMMKDYRIGSTVFYQRPSTIQLMIQFVSLLAAVLSALGNIIFNAIS